MEGQQRMRKAFHPSPSRDAKQSHPRQFEHSCRAGHHDAHPRIGRASDAEQLPAIQGENSREGDAQKPAAGGHSRRTSLAYRLGLQPGALLSSPAVSSHAREGETSCAEGLDEPIASTRRSSTSLCSSGCHTTGSRLGSANPRRQRAKPGVRRPAVATQFQKRGYRRGTSPRLCTVRLAAPQGSCLPGKRQNFQASVSPRAIPGLSWWALRK